MAPRLGARSLIIVLATLLCFEGIAPADGLDAKGEAEAKEATRLYKQGSYEEAAKLFAKLSVDYPDMPMFERNVGACFYYLHKPEPAISNLHNYLNHAKDIEPDDKAVVERWIAEMEKVQAQAASAPSAAPSAQPAAPEVPLPPPLPTSAPAAAATTPGALDLAAKPEATPVESQSEARPFYKTWWFWTGAAVVVVGGTVTAILLAGRSSGPCDGASLPCQGVR